MVDIFEQHCPDAERSRIWDVIAQPQRDHQERMHSLVERAWELYSPHAESGFLRDLQGRHFSQRWWEMYLWLRLHEMGLELAHPGEGMPDCEARWRKRKIFFECVSPTVGTGENRISEFPTGEAHQVPEDEVVLRMTSVIRDKNLQAERRDTRTGVENYVIALDTSQLQGSGFDKMFCLRSVYPIGNQTVTFYPGDERDAEWSYEYRPEIAREGRTSIPTSAFLMTKEYTRISAVLFCNANIGNIANGANPAFTVVHNHHAQKALSRKLFRKHEQYSWNGVSALNRSGRPSEEAPLEEILSR